MAIPDNKRIFYACQAVGFEAPHDTGATTGVFHGLQSVGVTTNFNLEQAFELGQIQIYENIEGLPEVEVTMEKVLDGYPLIYECVTAGATGSTLVATSAERANIFLGIYDAASDVVGKGSGIQAQVFISGCYINSISYSLPVDGNCTESITMVANDKTWTTTAANGVGASPLVDATVRPQFDADNDAIGDDIPRNNISAGGFNGGIQRRENVLMASSIVPASVIRAADADHTAVGSVSTSAGNNVSSGANIAHIQSVNISTDFGREDINELGKRTPYFRAANFPIEVTCEIEVISTEGDWVQAYEAGDPANIGTASEGSNTPEETIKFVLDDGTTFDLGSKNRLSSVSYGGGDAGGGNATMTFSYTTFNDLTVTSPATAGTNR
jgi:hypothetical protein